MVIDEIRGLYSPSYFNIRINTSEDLHPLEKVSPEFISTYFHEYFHFLQDITSPFGHNSAWNTFDRTIRLLQYAQQNNGPIEVPLKTNPVLSELDNNYKLQLAILLDKTPFSPDGIKKFNDFIIDKVSLPTRVEAEKLIPGGIIRFVKLELKNKHDQKAAYWFGAISAMETMTHLIQTKFFGPRSAPEYPYRSGINLVTHSSAQLKGNEEFVFSLCDVSLLSPYPGWTFYELLVAIDQQKFSPKSGEDIYQFGIDHIERKWRLWDSFKKYKDALLNIISKLYGHPAFLNDKEWLLHIIEEGYKIRVEEPTFMLDLYKKKVPFSPELLALYKRIGAPETINANNKRWFAAPEKLIDKQDSIHTVFLSGFKQVQNLLLFGKRECIMVNHCKGSQQKMPVDQNCYESPWLKSRETFLCPFGALWKSFGLDQKEIIIK